MAFAITGLWLGGNDDAVNAMIALINSYIPGLIGPTTGSSPPRRCSRSPRARSGVLGVTGLIALGAVIWTAIGWVTYSRRGVRDIFGIPPDRRSYVLLKARDLLAAIIFGAALIIGALLTWVSSWLLTWILVAGRPGLHHGHGRLEHSHRLGHRVVRDQRLGAGRPLPLPHRDVAALAA